MKNNYDVVIGLDPGVTGGISIVYKNGKVNVHRIPVNAIVVNGKNKKNYDLESIVDLLEPFRGQKVLFVQERVSSMPGEGSVSAFSFGRSSGATVGIAKALKFDVVKLALLSGRSILPRLLMMIFAI